MKKKILAVALVVALLAVAVIGSTLAYFTDTDSKDNVFTVGNVDIELTEPNWVEADAQNVYPGQTIAKDPIVENVGANPCYVRLLVTGLDALGDNELLIALSELGAGWTRDGDYLYYEPVLAVGETAPAAFSSIIIPTAADGTVNGGTVTVLAQAVQSQGFDSYGDAFAAAFPEG